MKLSRPDAFNDPWDCRVHFSVPPDWRGRWKLVQWLADQHRERHPEWTETERGHRAKQLILCQTPRSLRPRSWISYSFERGATKATGGEGWADGPLTIDAAREAWNKRIAKPDAITSMGMGQWAHVGQES